MIGHSANSDVPLRMALEHPETVDICISSGAASGSADISESLTFDSRHSKIKYYFFNGNKESGTGSVGTNYKKFLPLEAETVVSHTILEGYDNVKANHQGILGIIYDTKLSEIITGIK